MKKVIGTLIGIGLLLLSGCAPSAPSPTPLRLYQPTLPPTATPVPTPTPGPVLESAEELIGTWHKTPPNLFMGEVYRQYREDGTFRSAAAVDLLEDKPRVEGEFWFEGRQLFVKDIAAGAPGWDECVKSQQIGKYEVQVLANGNIKLVKIEDECLSRGTAVPGEYERVP